MGRREHAGEMRADGSADVQACSGQHSAVSGRQRSTWQAARQWDAVVSGGEIDAKSANRLGALFGNCWSPNFVDISKIRFLGKDFRHSRRCSKHSTRHQLSRENRTASAWKTLYCAMYKGKSLFYLLQLSCKSDSAPSTIKPTRYRISLNFLKPVIDHPKLVLSWF
jgi:hypothetical protein